MPTQRGPAVHNRVPTPHPQGRGVLFGPPGAKNRPPGIRKRAGEWWKRGFPSLFHHLAGIFMPKGQGKACSVQKFPSLRSGIGQRSKLSSLKLGGIHRAIALSGGTAALQAAPVSSLTLVRALATTSSIQSRRGGEGVNIRGGVSHSSRPPNRVKKI